MRIRLTLALPFFALGAGTTDAQHLTDLICDDRARLESQLQVSMDVIKQGQGVRGPDALMEVWIDQRSGDWTLVQSYSNGRSCIVAMGQHWEVLSRDPA